MRRPFGSRRGSAAVESAVCVTVVLLLMFAAVEIALLANASGTVAFAVGQAARYAGLRGAESSAPMDAGQIESYLRSQAPALNPNRLRVTTEWLPGSQVHIRAEYAAPLLLHAGGPSVKLGSSAAVVLSR